MGPRDEPENDELRMKRIGEESEKQEAAKYSIWDKLAQKILGAEQYERRKKKRKPNS